MSGVEPFRVEQTEEFRAWLHSLRDLNGRAAINKRIDRLARGLLGDSKSVGDGVNELRIDYGPGYRLYYARRSREIILLLRGGDKATQGRDIERAKAMIEEL